MSYYISKMAPNKYKYILNDNYSLLVNLYNIAKDEDKSNELNNKINILVDQFNELKTDKDRKVFWHNNTHKLENIENYVFKCKYRVLGRMCPLFGRYEKLKRCDINKSPIVDFFRSENIEFNNINDTDIIEKHKDSANCLFLIDPPYLQSCNDFYQNKNVNIYQYLDKTPIKDMKAKIYLILENNWIMNLLFKNNHILLETDKKYEISKKKTTHYIISNQAPEEQQEEGKR